MKRNKKFSIAALSLALAIAAVPTTFAATKISTAKAKSIALKDAGVSSKKAKFTKVKLERDDDIWQYDIEFRVGRVEYEYEIHATSGRILESDVDYDD